MKFGWRVVGGGVRVAALALFGFVGVAGCAEYEMEPNFPSVPVEEAPLSSASLQAIPPSAPAPMSEDIVIGLDETRYVDTDPSALTDFRAELEPHGAFVDDDTYGVVWVPSAAAVGPNFTPYVTAGHWVYEDDWIWVSDYSWGWAPFHYGRWVYITGRGWAWIPGRVYRGAWVTWRVGYGSDGYIGWAPMAPTWYWRGGMAVGLYIAPAPRYVYCGRRDVFGPGVGGRVITGPRAVAAEAKTAPFIPAQPTVNGALGGRVVASPTVSDGRMLANPSVVSSGPDPGALGFAPDQLARPRPEDAGMRRARAFATPDTAVAAGAQPPRGSVSVSGAGAPRRESIADSIAVSPSVGEASRARPSFVAGGNAAVSDRPAPAAATPSVAPRASAPREASPRIREASPAVREAAPSFGGGGSSGRAPSFRDSSSSLGSSRAYGGGASPSIRSAPTVRASPSVRSGGAPAVRATPRVRGR